MKKQIKSKGKPTTLERLHQLETHAAGIDIGANEIWVAVPPERVEQPIRRFGAFTVELKAIVAWLQQCQIRTVAMESTGLYWIPLYQLLADAGLKVCLVNARHVKNVPGRKSDVRDCQWLQYLHSVGLLRASYRPQQAVCAVRSIYRYRQNLITLCAQHVQHMQGALDQMNVKLHHVIDDLTGVTGLAIVEAILAGQRDPLQLAKYRHPRIRATQQSIAKALEGDWRSEQLFVLKTAWENWKHAQEQIQKCDQQLLQYSRRLEDCTRVTPAGKTIQLDHQKLGGAQSHPTQARPKRASKNDPNGPWQEELCRIFGVDLTAIPGVNLATAMTLMSELGNDLSAFKNAHHFASWLCLCPDNETSASKVLRRATRRSQNRVRQALRMAASSLHHSYSYLGEKYRRLRTKLGAPKAITAMAHQLARIIWHLIVHQVPFDTSIFAAQQKANELRRFKRLSSAARQMGFTLTPLPT